MVRTLSLGELVCLQANDTPKSDRPTEADAVVVKGDPFAMQIDTVLADRGLVGKPVELNTDRLLGGLTSGDEHLPKGIKVIREFEIAAPVNHLADAHRQRASLQVRVEDGDEVVHGLAQIEALQHKGAFQR